MALATYFILFSLISKPYKYTAKTGSRLEIAG